MIKLTLYIDDTKTALDKPKIKQLIVVALTNLCHDLQSFDPDKFFEARIDEVKRRTSENIQRRFKQF